MASDDNTHRNDGIDVTLTEGEGWARTLTVTVSEERVSRTRTAETKRLSQSVKLKGFRKGKVPSAVVEQKFGHEIDDRVQQRLLDEGYREALRETQLSPAGPGRIIDVRYEPGTAFMFQAELEIMPRVTLSRTGGFQVSRTVAPVTDEEVEEIFEQIRDENGEWATVDRAPEIGDRVSVTISPLAEGADTPEGEGTPYQLVLGQGKALDDVEAAIRTLAPDESGIFSIEFPREAEPGEEEAEAVVTRRLHIALNGVEEKQLPEVTDEFAASIGDFETVAQLEEAVREDLARHHERDAEENVRGALMEALREANPFVVPQALVDRYLENMLQAPEDVGAEELQRMREAVGAHAERQIRDQLLIDAIIEQEELQASAADVEERITELAESRGVDPAKLRRDLAREGRIDAVGRNLAVEKAFAYLKEQSGVS
ncbi:MAG: trigger factor [Gemmatimonadales bacterium]|jgi:trigger factor